MREPTEHRHLPGRPTRRAPSRSMRLAVGGWAAGVLGCSVLLVVTWLQVRAEVPWAELGYFVTMVIAIPTIAATIVLVDTRSRGPRRTRGMERTAAAVSLFAGVVTWLAIIVLAVG